MFVRIRMYLIAVLFTGCSTINMERLPGLQTDSVSYAITEMPRSFSGGDIVFGPYSATKIARGWIKGNSSGWSLGKLEYENESKGQDYSFQFTGHNSWEGECRASAGQQTVSIVSYGFYVDLGCGFSSPTDDSAEWDFSFKGSGPEEATGRIDFGSKVVVVKSIDRADSSSLKLGFNTGYYFYVDDRIVAAVDVVSKAGPVWFNNALSLEERDKIGLVAVAFLLNQIAFGN